MRVVRWFRLGAVAALAVGCGSAGALSPSSPATLTSGSPTTSPAGTQAAPIPSARTLRAVEEPLEPGTYRVALSELARGGRAFPAIRITLSGSWSNTRGWIVNRIRAGETVIAIQFWDVDQVYGHPCQWQGTLVDPGPSVDALASALADVPLRNATEPTAVELDGRTGKYLEWSVPDDINFADCDADGGDHYFESWTGPADSWATDRYQQGPGQLDRLWILDVDGSRLVIDAFSMPEATATEIAELEAAVESIRFEDR